MGYKTRVAPKGPDRGVDVLASPDGLGLEEPRIKAEVKHRTNSMGAQDIRSFPGGLRNGDRGRYVSTGGFSRDARYKADRSPVPITLIDLNHLATLIVGHHDSFDSEGRVLAPLARICWSVEWAPPRTSRAAMRRPFDNRSRRQQTLKIQNRLSLVPVSWNQ